jgi:hypothetical protein
VVFNPLRIEECHSKIIGMNPNSPDDMRGRETEVIATNSILAFDLFDKPPIEKQPVANGDQPNVIPGNLFAFLWIGLSGTEFNIVGVVEPVCDLPLIALPVVLIKPNPFALDTRLNNWLLEICFRVERTDTHRRRAAAEDRGEA